MSAIHSTVVPLAILEEKTQAQGELSPNMNAVRKSKRFRKPRPARCQFDLVIFKTVPPSQTATIFNVWFNKWAGSDSQSAQQTPARGRCNIAKDSGYTQADKAYGSYFCLFFARGLCHRGRDCQYLHRLPTATDIFSPHTDCFGREKFAEYRNDHGGVGSFMRHNRTIYVGSIHAADSVEEVVARHFQEFGQIDRIRVLNNRGIAFITYTNEANAQFAKEAMTHQPLDHEEVLNVKWAHEDPNSAAKAREQRYIEEQAANAIGAPLPHDYLDDLEGRNSEVKKRRKVEENFRLVGHEIPDHLRNHCKLLAQSRASTLLEMPLDEGHKKDTSREEILPSSVLARLNPNKMAFGVAKKRKATELLVDYSSDDS